jgi:hypothetical protein
MISLMDATERGQLADIMMLIMIIRARNRAPHPLAGSVEPSTRCARRRYGDHIAERAVKQKRGGHLLLCLLYLIRRDESGMRRQWLQVHVEHKTIERALVVRGLILCRLCAAVAGVGSSSSGHLLLGLSRCGGGVRGLN